MVNWSSGCRRVPYGNAADARIAIMLRRPEHQKPSCPGCGGRCAYVGLIPVSTRFAGRAVDFALPRGSLYRCRACHLQFRSPSLDVEQLNKLYRVGASDTWTAHDPDRTDWPIAARWIVDTMPAARVLDVGCWDGGFLGSLPPTYKRFGIEIHQEAADRAAKDNGVQVVGADLGELDDWNDEYDVVVCFDVIEHVHNPQRLLAQLAAHTRPGGSVIIGTGNADSPSWRLMGASYWYVWYPEHLAFASPRWCRAVAAQTGLDLHRVQRISREVGQTRFPVETVKNAVYRLLPRAVSRGLRRVQMKRRGFEMHGLADAPPMWSTARDHFVAELRKPSR